MITIWTVRILAGRRRATGRRDGEPNRQEVVTAPSHQLFVISGVPLLHRLLVSVDECPQFLHLLPEGRVRVQYLQIGVAVVLPHTPSPGTRGFRAGHRCAPCLRQRFIRIIAQTSGHFAAAAEYQAPTDAYGNVNRIQRTQFAGHEIASRLKNPNFVTLAESFGVEGRRATSPAALRTHLRDALSNGHPALIEVPIGEVPSMWGLQLTR